MRKALWCLVLLHLLLAKAHPETLLEEATYKVYFGIIKVGTARIRLYRSPNSQYHAVITARTTGIADLIYPVRDRMESWFNPEHFTKYSARIREGNYKRNDLIIYQNGTLSYFKNGKLKRKIQIPPPIHDMVSAYFAYRMNPTCGKLPFLITSGKKTARPQAECLNTSKKGILAVNLKAKIKGLLFARDPKKPVYMELDNRTRILILARVPTRWGTIKIKLQRYRTLPSNLD